MNCVKRMYWSQQTPSTTTTSDDSTHGHHQMINTKIRLIIFLVAKDGEVLQSVKTRADCGLDHKHLNAKFRPTLKKVGKTSRPFRYNLNQIPYDYTAEVMKIQEIRSGRQNA